MKRGTLSQSGYDNALENLAGYTAVKLMYRDVDLMDGTPEIGTALDIISEDYHKLAGVIIDLYNNSLPFSVIVSSL